MEFRVYFGDILRCHFARLQSWHLVFTRQTLIHKGIHINSLATLQYSILFYSIPGVVRIPTRTTLTVHVARVEVWVQCRCLTLKPSILQGLRIVIFSLNKRLPMSTPPKFVSS